MRNFLMLLAAVLGTSVMVSAFPAHKTEPAKEVKAPTQPKAKSEKKTDKKAKTEKKEASKTETAKVKK
ncbi:hypothetical protein GKZ90_0007215 [Flavobacterium sp. MC2016-06]|uniref:hypothetical protein n=1 Tax=Flavobacterium sp. MC2016-06 TaxID=2676308 RepID=UPI0012BAD62A|nr:hypothetical protein [Flavobacterium sp. MC2016-06]MBU3858184.1 hypothetical protein [Flavobacterium sp. MC2016-06]